MNGERTTSLLLGLMFMGLAAGWRALSLVERARARVLGARLRDRCAGGAW